MDLECDLFLASSNIFSSSLKACMCARVSSTVQAFLLGRTRIGLEECLGGCCHTRMEPNRLAQSVHAVHGSGMSSDQKMPCFWDRR
jgi:hypothetical protein